LIRRETIEEMENINAQFEDKRIADLRLVAQQKNQQ
jgi:hypothetical protein